MSTPPPTPATISADLHRLSEALRGVAASLRELPDYSAAAEKIAVDYVMGFVENAGSPSSAGAALLDCAAGALAGMADSVAASEIARPA